MPIPQTPNILEINTAVFLYLISQRYDCPATLEHVPDEELDKIARLGFDAVWLMGVWERSPLGRDMARGNVFYHSFIDNPTADDIIGSAYSISRYEVSALCGGREELASFRSKLAARGIGLILDYVPNHVGLDHHWIMEHPEYFMQGSPEDIENRPDAFYRTESAIIARGKDPNFPAWSDVAQLNAFSSELRQASIDTLIDIASQCDGVRCDMAMLLMNDIFGRTWGKRAGRQPEADFWPTLINAVRKQYPDFCFIAEVYWDKEAELIEQGFSYCYDKKFYDVLVKLRAAHAIDYLQLQSNHQATLLRFIANHDEKTPAELLTLEQEKAAAVILATQPSGRMVYDSQLTGYPQHIPVQLGRGPVHPPDKARELFYEELLVLMKEHAPQADSDWRLARSGGSSHQAVLTWSWRRGAAVYTTFVNYSATTQNTQRQPPKNTSGLIFGTEPTVDDKGAILLEPWQYVVYQQLD